MGEVRTLCWRLENHFRDSEVDDLRDRLALLGSYQQVRRLEIPVDDSLLMGVVNAVAHADEELNTGTELASVGLSINAKTISILGKLPNMYGG